MIETIVPSNENKLSLPLSRSSQPSIAPPSKEAVESSLVHTSYDTGVHWTCGPTVLAMLTGNTMSNCEEVKRMYDECQRTGATDRLCEVAARKYNLCKQNGEL